MHYKQVDNKKQVHTTHAIMFFPTQEIFVTLAATGELSSFSQSAISEILTMAVGAILGQIGICHQCCS